MVRREDDGIRRYCHIGTGNYNSKTARIYEDLGLLTSDPDIGADVGELFNYLTGFSRHADYRQILVSPVTVRNRIMEMIEEQADAGPAGRIVMKLNGLTDASVIDALYRASVAGVPIDLVVRGLCWLRPGMPGLSERIRVRSIVGSFLEHSRIYRFGGAPADPAAGSGLPLRSTSAPRTSWGATSTGGSRSSSRCTTPSCRRGCSRCWTSCSPTRPTPGSSARTGAGAGCPTVTG